MLLMLLLLLVLVVYVGILVSRRKAHQCITYTLHTATHNSYTGVVYEATVVSLPGTVCVINASGGGGDAKVEAIFNDMVQLRPDVNNALMRQQEVCLGVAPLCAMGVHGTEIVFVMVMCRRQGSV